MSTMGGALPHPGQSPSTAASPMTPRAPIHPYSTASFYQMQHPQQLQGGQGMQFDAATAARFQQQQHQHYRQAAQGAMMTRPQLQLPLQPQGQYGRQNDPSAFNMNQFQVSPVDPRIGHHNPFDMPHGPAGDLGQYSRRASEPAAVPSFPRGPPRKPKQSGYALWVGNLPPAATITDLKDHFSRDATKDIESLFLISKSNCAFVNYRSEAGCQAAMNRFHDSRFQGIRLVCRLRRGATTGLSSSTGGNIPESPSSIDSPVGSSSRAVFEEQSSPTIVGRPQPTMTTTPTMTVPEASDRSPKMPEKFFVVKSLTVRDLEASVRNGTWATQSHNENVLNQAYEEADTVYLIFSANKSGEYFGYGRMASTISGEPVNLSSNFTTQIEARSPGVPQSIRTSATTNAPKGRIIDDSARGTIFWEAELLDDEEEESSTKDSSEIAGGQNSGRQFTIDWISTTRLPFYHTRGLRNPWNANREVKIARDGTEIEPSVGRRLVQMFR